jgi:hypothetical protein
MVHYAALGRLDRPALNAFVDIGWSVARWSDRINPLSNARSPVCRH